MGVLGPLSVLAILVGTIFFGAMGRWYQGRAATTSPLVPAGVCATTYAGVFAVVGAENGILTSPPWLLICLGIWAVLVPLLFPYFRREQRGQA